MPQLWRQFYQAGEQLSAGTSLVSIRLMLTTLIPLFASLSIFNSPLKNLNLCGNDLGSESKTIAQAVLLHTSMEVFCEIPMKELRAESLTELDMKRKYIGAHGAIVLTELLKVSSPLKELNLWNNNIGKEGAAALAAVLPSR